MSGPWELYAKAQPQDPGPWDLYRPPSSDIDFKGPDDQVRKAIAALPENQRKEAYRSWAKAKVAADKPNRSTAASIGMNLAAGTPIGSFLDEMAGAYSAATGGSYDEGKASYEARQKAAEDESTSLGTLPLIGEVKTSGVQKVLGGILSAPLSPVANIVKGTTMLPRIANSMATGAGYGALYGAGEGEGSDRAVNAAKGVGIGVGLGAVAPVVASGIAKGTAAVKDGLRPLPKELAPYEKGAVERVAELAKNDDLPAILSGQKFNDQMKAAAAKGGGQPSSTTENVWRANPNLGAEGMLLDMGPNLRGGANALGNRPGENMTVVREGLTNRRMDAQRRVDTDLNVAYGTGTGQATKVATESSIKKIVDEANAAARPFYQVVEQTPIKVTPDLANLLDRAEAFGAIKQAEKLMRAKGFDPNATKNNAIYIDFVKRAVDDVAGTAKRAGENTVAAFASDIARGLRGELDAQMTQLGAVAKHPITGKTEPISAIARDLSGDGKQMKDAINLGMEAATKGRTADQVIDDLANLTQPQKQGYKLGYRTELAKEIEGAGTAFGANGDTKARSMLSSRDARRKLEAVLDDPRSSDRLLNRMDAETRFAQADQEILGNSATNFRIEAQKLFPEPTDASKKGWQIGQRTAFGTVAEGVYRIGNALLGGALNEKRARVATDAAKMLVSQGVEGQQIARALTDYMQKKKMSKQASANLERFIENLMAGTRPALIDQQTGP